MAWKIGEKIWPRRDPRIIRQLLVRNRVEAPAAKRPATRQPADGQPSPLGRAVGGQCLGGVLRARRVEAASRRPAEEKSLVDAHKRDPDTGGEGHDTTPARA